MGTFLKSFDSPIVAFVFKRAGVMGKKSGSCSLDFLLDRQKPSLGETNAHDKAVSPLHSATAVHRSRSARGWLCCESGCLDMKNFLKFSGNRAVVVGVWGHAFLHGSPPFTTNGSLRI